MINLVTIRCYPHVKRHRSWNHAQIPSLPLFFPSILFLLFLLYSFLLPSLLVADFSGLRLPSTPVLCHGSESLAAVDVFLAAADFFLAVAAIGGSGNLLRQQTLLPRQRMAAGARQQHDHNSLSQQQKFLSRRQNTCHGSRNPCRGSKLLDAADDRGRGLGFGQPPLFLKWWLAPHWALGRLST